VTVAASVRPGGALPRVIAFQEGLARRSAQTLVPIEGGFVVLDERYPASYEHNQVYVTGPVREEALLADAERLLRSRGHRQITVLHDALGRRLARRLVASGYEQERTVVMVLDAAAGRLRQPHRRVRVERVPLAALRAAVMRSWATQYPAMPEDTRRQLFERTFATAAACELGSHVVRARGDVVSWCHLYQVGHEAQVESVNTLTEWRGRGFARAVVVDAARAALERGCDLVFLIALYDDWPRHFYERLGFVPAGVQHSFLRA
jgi:GNAT superfamily N-acetyltransferase